MLLASSTTARESEGQRQNSILLNGTWEFAVGAGDELAETAWLNQSLPWKNVAIPGPFCEIGEKEILVSDQTRYVWTKRDFEATESQATALAVLRWHKSARNIPKKCDGGGSMASFHTCTPAGRERGWRPGYVRGASKVRSGRRIMPIHSRQRGTARFRAARTPLQ